jgi:hypothetical protein
MTINKITLGSLGATLLLGAGPLFAAKDFSCAPTNKVCILNDRAAVTGDQVGFFTERGELIATGKVTRMNGSKRSVQLQQVMGPVSTQAESYAMLEPSGSISQENYKVYKQPSPMAVGTRLGMTTFGAGSDAKGFELSASALRRKFLGKVDGVVTGSYYSLSGKAVNTANDQISGTFNAQSLAAAGGLAYTIFSQSAVSVRTEIGLGLAYTSAKINGNVDDAKSPDWGYQVASGFGPHMRGLIAAGYKFDGWQLEAGVAPAMLAGKSTTTIGAGLMMNLN